MVVRRRAAALVITSVGVGWRSRRYVTRRREAALVITRIGAGWRPKRMARRRREAATLIGKIARGKVTRTMMRGVASGVLGATKQATAATARAAGKITARSRTMGDLFGMRSAVSRPAALSRANTAPSRPTGGQQSSVCLVS